MLRQAFFAALVMGSPVMAEIQEVRIGVLNELTGPVAGLGAVCSRGIEIAMRQHVTEGKAGGAAIRIVMGDEKDDAKVAVSEFRRMIEAEGIQAVVAVRSRGAMPISPIAERAGIPLMGIVGATDFLSTNRYAIRAFVSPAQEAEVAVSTARRLGDKRAAIIAVEDEYPLALADHIEKKFAEAGGIILSRHDLSPGETDYSTVATKIRALNPDVVFVYSMMKTGLLVRKLRELGVDAQIISQYWIQQPEQMQAAGAEALENLVFVEVNSNQPKLKQAYAETFPGQPYNPAAYLCYSAVAALIEAVKLPGATRDAHSLREAFVGIARVPLLDGDLLFKNREAQFELVPRRFQGVKVVDLHP